MSLSGDKPKRPNVIKSLALMLGPDFMTDILEVETSDHARLRLQLSYNWHFEVDPKDEKNAGRVFQVRDFVGDACKAIASRVRGAVASHSFDEFHRNSATIIRVAVFGYSDEATKKVGNKFLFNANNLAITNIDIQSVEPVDAHTRESLQKSVQLAIEITTRKQEQNARHEAQQVEQSAKGEIERQKIINQTESEEGRRELVELETACAAVASTGQATAEEQARAEYLEIEVKADVEQARLEAEADRITNENEMQSTRDLQKAEVDHQVALSDLMLKKAEALAQLESGKFKSIVDAITPKTIKAIAQAGPQMQARLLKALGLKGYLLTDGNSPVNLFNTAKRMVGQGAGVPGMPGM
jgi:major vault protein